MNVLVINAGSSSVKFSLLAMPHEVTLCAGSVSGLGTGECVLEYHTMRGKNKGSFKKDSSAQGHAEALQLVLQHMEADQQLKADLESVSLVGHRVVHGGKYFYEPTVVTMQVKKRLQQLADLAPLHNPPSYECMDVLEKYFPGAEQVAVFDTAFYKDLPAQAYLYAIPYELNEKHDVRTYGFHGISHQYVSSIARSLLNKDHCKIISIHLGNGCSITAISGDQPVDTSMGFTPMSGLVMGSRGGDIDPGVLIFMMKQLGLSIEQVEDLLNNESGLKGICGLSDMRQVHKAVRSGDQLALLACRLYVYRIKKYIGAYIAAMNGCDAIIFTGGVGANDAKIRRWVCENMEGLGILLDHDKNNKTEESALEIQQQPAATKIFIIPTNEELSVARQLYPKGKKFT